MSTGSVLAFATMAFVSSITPGPNNLMLMASGLNHGLRRTLPHLLGVNLGFLVLCLAVALGLAEIFVRMPAVQSGLKWLGAGYLCWLAWRIASAPPAADPAAPKGRSRPLGFVGAAAFQWVNPKAWVMALGAFTAYVPAGVGFSTLLAFALLFAVVNAPCIVAWTMFGVRLRHWLRRPALQRAFNRTMGALLVASLWPMLRTAGS
jgi:threonine/homoserine/homoserine lactone efflux protein